MFGYIRGAKIAWVGDGNNILHSLLIGCSKLGVDIAFATPPGYEPDPNVLSEAVSLAAKVRNLCLFGIVSVNCIEWFKVSAAASRLCHPDRRPNSGFWLRSGFNTPYHNFINFNL